MAETGQEMKHGASHNEWLKAKLADPEFAAEYLNAASEDDDPKVYLAALRHVVDARGGMAVVAEKASLSRETLYRTLSVRGNPTIRTLSAVLKATGLKFGVSAH
jgi:probable addiction module antidote protein